MAKDKKEKKSKDKKKGDKKKSDEAVEMMPTAAAPTEEVSPAENGDPPADLPVDDTPNHAPEDAPQTMVSVQSLTGPCVHVIRWDDHVCM